MYDSTKNLQTKLCMYDYEKRKVIFGFANFCQVTTFVQWRYSPIGGFDHLFVEYKVYLHTEINFILLKLYIS